MLVFNNATFSEAVVQQTRRRLQMGDGVGDDDHVWIHGQQLSMGMSDVVGDVEKQLFVRCWKNDNTH